ncbi:spore germination protein [Bacillus wiedmannii]|uniref:spore germination protein n=1 Tax=Bacillus wiedmannii TaxID=1890302 RepID=UPI0010BDCE12|nr:spore germination protein [Bacillus wiedmannii]TKH23908.1 spore germination protein [Bacillus wiedmannii]
MNNLDNDTISECLSENLVKLSGIFNHTSDLIIRHINMKQSKGPGALVYLDNLVDKEMLNNDVLKPLLYKLDNDIDSNVRVLPIGSVQESNLWNEIQEAILEGKSVLFSDENNYAMLFGTQGGLQRTIGESPVEISLKSGHHGFIESMNENIAMIRRYIHDPNLKCNGLEVGTRGKNKVSILYLKGIANSELLSKLEERIKGIDVDCILNAGELEEFIEDSPYSPFPQFLSTERPDFVASHILQGRFAIIVDQSPNVLIAPVTFASFFQHIDDYSMRLFISNFFRLLRYFSFFIAILLPAIYISIVSFNYEVIPVKLLLTIGEYRADVPFPPLIEAFMMEIALEMLRESAIRLPSSIAQTVGIVGAIIIGQAAVQAGIVSNLMIIVVASTAIASFIIPNYDMGSAIRFLRFPMMLIASLFGIVGIVAGLMTLIGHLISLESLGTPYGSPFAPIQLQTLKDSVFRFPLWKIKKDKKKSKLHKK